MTTARHGPDHGGTADAWPPPPRSRHARPGVSGRDFAPGAVIVGGQVGLRAVGGPWWTCCLLAGLGLAAVCLHIVFPQESGDKLAWWTERWKTRRPCHCQGYPPGLTAGTTRRTDAGCPGPPPHA